MIHDNAAFEIGRESVTAEQAAAYYGVAVNTHHRAACCFHRGKNPNLAFYGGGFVCFKCGESGSVIDFVMKLFNLSPIDALRKLNSDFNLGLELKSGVKPKINTYALQSIRRKTLEREMPEDTRNILADYSANLAYIKREFAPKTPDEEYHELWVYAVHNADEADFLLDFYETQDTDWRLGFINKNIEVLDWYEQFNEEVQRIFRKRNAA